MAVVTFLWLLDAKLLTRFSNNAEINFSRAYGVTFRFFEFLFLKSSNTTHYNFFNRNGNSEELHFNLLKDSVKKGDVLTEEHSF